MFICGQVDLFTGRLRTKPVFVLFLISTLLHKSKATELPWQLLFTFDGVPREQIKEKGRIKFFLLLQRFHFHSRCALLFISYIIILKAHLDYSPPPIPLSISLCCSLCSRQKRINIQTDIKERKHGESERKQKQEERKAK